MSEELPQVVILQPKLMKKKTKRIIFIISDIVAIAGFLTYCGFIQSYLSTIYLFLVLMLINYTYIKIIKGVRYEDKLISLDEFQQIQNGLEQQSFDRLSFWVEAYDVKKYIWIIIITFSSLTLLFKIIILPILYHVDNARDIMNIWNFQGLEIYYQDPMTGSDYIDMFIPNTLILIYSSLILKFREFDQKTQLYTFNQSTKQTKVIILFMQIFLILLISITRSIIGYILWIYLVVLLIKLYQDQLIEKYYILTLKFTIVLIIVAMFFASTPVINFGNFKATELINILGLELLINYAQHRIEAITFILVSITIFNMLCVLQEQINNALFRNKFQKAIDLALMIKELLKSSIDIENQPLKKSYEQLEQSKLRSNSLVQEEQFESQQIIEESDINEHQKSYEELDQQPQDGQDGNQEENDIQNDNQEENGAQNGELQKPKTISDKIDSYIMIAKKYIDNPYLTIRILQILTIIIIIQQKTYFSLGLVLWMIILGFTQNLKHISIITLLVLPFISINFGMFYYENIVQMNGHYSSCYPSTKTDVSLTPTSFCQKLGLYQTSLSYINTSIMNITLSLYVLLLRQIKDYKEDESKVSITWGNIIIAILFRLSFILSIIILYVVGFNQINVIQLILVLILLIFLINQSTRCQYQGRQVSFIYKYWGVLLFYVSMLMLGRYLTMMFWNPTSSVTLNIIGISNQNTNEILYWVLFYSAQIQYQSFNSKIYIQFQNSIMYLTNQKLGDKLPTVTVNILKLLLMRILIWTAYIINLIDMFYSPYSYINTILLLYIGISFLYYVSKIMTNINYNTIYKIWYVYLNLLIFTFLLRYCFQFICISSFSDVQNLTLKSFYANLQLFYQDYGFYAYEDASLKLEFFPDMVNILFGSFALHSFNQFRKASMIQNDDYANQLSETDVHQTKQLQQVMSISILKQWLWLKKPILLIAHLNTDILTVFVVASCVFYLRSIAALILLIVYLSYFLIVHNQLLNKLQENQILKTMQIQIKNLKDRYLLFKNVDDFSENQIKIMVEQLQLLRLTTRIRMKRIIWMISFYFTAFCIFLTYLSQFLTTESVKDLGQLYWVQKLATIFFVSGTFSQQIIVTDVCYCGINKNDTNCSSQTELYTVSNIWRQSWFYLVLLLANVLDTACTRILSEDLEDQRQKLEEEKLNSKQEILEMEFTMEVLEEFTKNYSHVKFQDNEKEIASDLDRESLIINFYRNKTRILNLTYQEAFFRFVQRVLTLILLSNTILVNTLFSLVYLIVSTILFQMKASLLNVKILNTFSIFAIWFQYSLYLMDWQPLQKNIPKITGLQSSDFSIMTMLEVTNPYQLSYFGFRNGELLDCDELDQSDNLFQNETCETNQLLNWVFIFNLLVISLIYVYFLLLEWLAQQIYKSSAEMKHDVLLTKSCLRNQIIQIDFQKWKTRSFTFKQTVLQIFIRNSHMVLIALILILSQTNRTLFNLFEMVLAIIFVYITEFHFEWPYLYSKKQFILDMFKALYYIPVIAIAAFTLLKAPFILSVCKNQTITYIKGEPVVSADDSLIFYCVEVFNIRITGMVFIMFFISLYFELVASQEYQKQIQTFQIKEQLRARLVQKALSYQQTQQKYIEILKQQKQKNIFKQISQQIEVKLRKWQQKFKSQANKVKEEEQAEQEIKIQSLYPESVDFRKQQKQEQLEQEENFNKLTSTQKFCITSILFVRKYNHTIKFMSLQQLLDQILQQNQLLKRYVVLTIEKHLTDSMKIYQFELDIIDKFYEDAKKLFVKQKCKLSEQQIQTLLNNIIKRRSDSQQFEDSIADQPELDGNFVSIKDVKNKILIKNTKLDISQNALVNFKTSQLVAYLFLEFLKLLIARWQSFTCILIIFYYAKNSALLGIVLPLTLFSWFIIDENSKYFWGISYSIYSSILILIFLSTLYGINYDYPDSPYQNTDLPWYYPLDNSGNNGLFFEIFIMWLIQFEVFLMKQFGVYYKRLTQIENTFQGYMRLKINKFNIEDKKNDQEEQFEIDIPEEQMNSLEKKIMKNPQLLNDNYQTKFFDRIFTFEFSRPGYDLYPYIVTVQLMLFIYMLLFFNFMINAEADLTQYIKYNQIPGTLVLALTAHIFLMVWERYLVLLDDKRNLQITKGQKKKFFEIYKSQFVLKFITQIIVLILVFWFVFYNLGKPWSDSTQDNGIDNQFVSNGYIICFFLLYCCYFYLSALQLKYGYAELKIRNSFLYTYTNMNNLFVQTFYAIPFLFELKVLMDWTFLDTALDIWQWFRLEDIHGLLFFSKIQSKTYLDRKIGLKIGAFAKCGMGCTLVTVILLCIIGPLILFSSLNPSTEINLVNGGGLEISLVNVKTNLNIQLFSTLQLLGLESGTIGSKQEVKSQIQPSLTNPLLLNAPKTGSIQRFQIISFSDVNWALSQPLYDEIVKELKQTLEGIDEGQFMINVTYYMQRQIEQSLPQKNSFSYPYNPSLVGYAGHETTYLNKQILEQIYDSIVNCAQIPINLTNFYIETLQLYTTDGINFKPRPIIGNGVNSNMDVQMSLQCAPGLTIPIEGSSWWNFTYIGSSQQYLPQYSNINGMLFFVVSDKYSSFTSGFSIITIYTTVILLIGQFIRSTFSGKVWMIEYNEAMLPDDILMLCESIAIARSNQDYKKENMLYYELIDILRSPEITKVMTGSWSETFKEIEKKQKQD